MAAIPAPKLQSIPHWVACAGDYEPLARERLSDAAWAYLAGGAADELTLQDNVAAFQRLRLRSRVLEDMNGGDTRLTLFGQSFESPIFLGPVAHQRLFDPDGERATVLAAGATGLACVISTQSSLPLEEIAAHAAAPLWFQLYIQPDRGFTRELVRRAERSGYAAIVVTVDAPVSGPRNREQRAGSALPSGLQPPNLQGMRPFDGGTEDGRLLGSPLMAAAPTWRDIAELRAQTKLPILLKGIMTPEDADRALAEGIDGLVVSNHGGRTLDGLPASIDALPTIAAAVDRRVPLLLDSGIRRGSDVLKALALGARAVLVGRPYIHGLAAAGPLGVAHVARILRAELEIAMALTGCRDLASIRPSQPVSRK